MSRSGYSKDLDNWSFIRWRGAVSSATKGKRGQAFFKELLNALDKMPVKCLIADRIEADGQFCALGVLGKYREIDMTAIHPEDPEQVSKAFDISRALAKEVVYMNDEYYDEYHDCKETPESRWKRMRQWVITQIAT